MFVNNPQVNSELYKVYAKGTESTHRWLIFINSQGHKSRDGASANTWVTVEETLLHTHTHTPKHSVFPTPMHTVRGRHGGSFRNSIGREFTGNLSGWKGTVVLSTSTVLAKNGHRGSLLGSEVTWSKSRASQKGNAGPCSFNIRKWLTHEESPPQGHKCDTNFTVR